VLLVLSTRNCAPERLAWIAIALRPACFVARIISIGLRLSRVAGAATEVACIIVAIATTNLRRPQVVIAIEIVVRIASAAALVIEWTPIVVTRVVVARIEIHDSSSNRTLCDSKLG